MGHGWATAPGVASMPEITKGLDLGWERGLPSGARPPFEVLSAGEVIGKGMEGLVMHWDVGISAGSSQELICASVSPFIDSQPGLG